jgi:putative ABC transport system permease protein
MLSDVRLAARRLWRQPGFTALTIAILALGIGAATAMFSMVNALALRPLPYAGADRLVHVQRSIAGRTSGCRRDLFRELRARNTVFEEMGGFGWGDRTRLSRPGRPAEMLWGLAGSVEFFRLLGVAPTLGRLFLPEEDQPGGPGVVVLSDRLWRARFGADPAVVGRHVQIDGEALTVIGVMAPEFTDPTLYWSRVDILRPLRLPPASPRDREDGVNVFARLKPGVTRAAAQVELDAIAASLPDTRPDQMRVLVQPLRETSGLNRTSRRVVWLSLALATFVLMIACINLAGVQLARLASRGHEHAIRLSLGARRGHLVREVLIESLLLSFAGGALGVGLASWCTGMLAPRLVVGTSHTTVGVTAALDGRVLAAALAMVLVTALGVGLVPGWLSSAASVSERLKHAGRASTGRAQPRARQLLVAGQMGLALTLLAAGGLLVRGLSLLGDRHPGWNPDGLLTAMIRPAPGVDDRDRLQPFALIQQRLSVLPGVERAALSSWLPLPNFTTRSIKSTFRAEGQVVASPATAPLAYVNSIDPEYLATLGMTVIEGRGFRPDDGPGGLPVVIINQAIARQFWPGQSPIGRRIGNASGDPRWRTIVGVVADVGFAASLEPLLTRFEIYRPFAQYPTAGASVTLRSQRRPDSLVEDVRRAVASVDPEWLVWEAMPARALMNRSLANFEMTGWIVAGCAALGVVLAALGVYGLFAGFVVDRRREIGVRVALGAQRPQVLWLVMRQGLRLALAGVVVGVVGAGLAVRLLVAVTPELPEQHPAVVAAMAALLVVVAVFACWLPARRAAGVDPMVALRSE